MKSLIVCQWSNVYVSLFSPAPGSRRGVRQTLITHHEKTNHYYPIIYHSENKMNHYVQNNKPCTIIIDMYVPKKKSAMHQPHTFIQTPEAAAPHKLSSTLSVAGAGPELSLASVSGHGDLKTKSAVGLCLSKPCLLATRELEGAWFRCDTLGLLHKNTGHTTVS